MSFSFVVPTRHRLYVIFNIFRIITKYFIFLKMYYRKISEKISTYKYIYQDPISLLAEKIKLVMVKIILGFITACILIYKDNRHAKLM